MRSSRLLDILLTLQLRGRVPASELARACEVSTRTIYRDVDALSAAGVPIYAETGRNGGITLHDGYRTRLTGLTAAEAAALPLVGLAQASELGMSAEAATVRLKLLASLTQEAAAAAQQIGARFHIDPTPWYHRAETLRDLPTLAAAVWRDRRIRARYASWTAGGQRTLDPLGLVQKGGLWYLVAAWRGKPRTYRVAQLSAVEVLDAAVLRPAGFDLSSYWGEAVRSFEDRLLSQIADVRISEEGERILRAVMPAAAEMVARTRRPGDQPGWFAAQMPYETADYSARQILRLGREVEVLSPPNLRAAVAAEAAAVASCYRQDA
jgi:predicted DNA-binding transcriptional regulator YafY